MGSPSLAEDPTAPPGLPVAKRPQDRFAALLLPPLAVLFVTLFAVFFWFNTSMQVDGESMLPTLRPNDRVLLTRGYPRPARGDIIAFVIPEDGVPTELVKRVVGVPGDRVRVVGDSAWVNGEPEGAHAMVARNKARDFGEVVVKPGYVFVLGDNRPISNDSRYLGQVPLSSVKGKATWIFAPVTRVRRVTAR